MSNVWSTIEFAPGAKSENANGTAGSFDYLRIFNSSLTFPGNV